MADAFETAAAALLESEEVAGERVRQLVALSPWQITICEGTEALDVALAMAEARHLDVCFILPNGMNRWTVIARRPVRWTKDT